MESRKQPAWPLLETIDDPADLRRLPRNRLDTLARELRLFLLDTVSSTGGHLSAGLGTVELTIALHYVFNTPEDRLVWDVGHQTYPHKILTGRRKQMASLRQRGGIAGFPKRDESEYDAFGTGHSSTSIAAALGMSIAAEKQGIRRKSVAVIGDGAMTAGMAFEALNHAGDCDADLLVILNDNDMSISANVGGLSNHLTRLLSGNLYSSLREGGKRVFGNLPPMLELARKTEEHVKGMVAPGTLFEELGFHYFGPVDGHDLDTLVPVLDNLKQMRGPRLLHVVTQKGKGYFPAEDDPGRYHGVSRFDPSKGIDGDSKTTGTQTFTQVFSDWLHDMAVRDEHLMGITPAMKEGSGLTRFAQRFPDRYFDVGIAEQHAVTLAAGMACDGLKPVVAIYSTFLQRGYDQLIHDVAIQKLPVMFAIDRAGIVGADGQTHSGAYDISFLRCIPGLVIMTPWNETETRRLLTTAFLHDGPTAVRYPRGSGVGTTVEEELNSVAFGRAEILREGTDIAILGFGSLLAKAIGVADTLDATLVNMRFVKPLDQVLIDEIADTHQLIVTLEDNAIAGGAGSAVAEYLSATGKNVPVLHLGYPDELVEQGSQQELHAAWGLDSEGIHRAIEQRVHASLIRNC